MLCGSGIELAADDKVKTETTATADTTVSARVCTASPTAFDSREMSARSVRRRRTASQCDLRVVGGDDGNGQCPVEWTFDLVERLTRADQEQRVGQRTVCSYGEVQP